MRNKPHGNAQDGPKRPRRAGSGRATAQMRGSRSNDTASPMSTQVDVTANRVTSSLSGPLPSSAWPADPGRRWSAGARLHRERDRHRAGQLSRPPPDRPVWRDGSPSGDASAAHGTVRVRLLRQLPAGRPVPAHPHRHLRLPDPARAGHLRLPQWVTVAIEGVIGLVVALVFGGDEFRASSPLSSGTSSAATSPLGWQSCSSTIASCIERYLRTRPSTTSTRSTEPSAAWARPA